MKPLIKILKRPPSYKGSLMIDYPLWKKQVIKWVLEKMPEEKKYKFNSTIEEYSRVSYNAYRKELHDKLMEEK